MTSLGVRAVLSSMRKNNRRTVVQPVTLGVGSFDFDCTAYDISLGGIRVKVDMSIEQGSGVCVQLRNKMKRQKIEKLEECIKSIKKSRVMRMCRIIDKIRGLNKD